MFKTISTTRNRNKGLLIALAALLSLGGFSIIAGGNNSNIQEMRAETATMSIDFTNTEATKDTFTGLPSSSQSSDTTFTVDSENNLACVIQKGYKNSSNPYLMLGKSGAYLYNTTSLVDSYGTINSITVNYSGGTSENVTYNIAISDSVISSAPSTWTATGTKATKNGSDTFNTPASATNAGYFRIQISSAYNIQIASIDINYTLPMKDPMVEFEPATLSGSIGDMPTLTAKASNFTGAALTYTWTLAEGGDAYVEFTAQNEEALFEFKAVGKTSITCSVTDNTDTAEATCEIEVFAALPTSITIKDPSGSTSGSISISDTIQLSASILPADADQNVIWSSGDETIATVDENGLVTGVAGGAVSIKATSASVSTVFGEYALKVVGYTYELVNSASDLVLGDTYTIAYNNGTSSKAISATQDSNNRKTVAVTVSSGTFSADDGAASIGAFVLAAGTVDGSYAFYDAGNKGYLYAASSGSNHLKTESDLSVDSSFSITFSTDAETKEIITSVVATGSSNRNVLQYNSGNTLFSCYESANQENVTLFHATNVANEGTANAWAKAFLDESGKVCSQTQDLANPDGLMGNLSISTLSTPAQDILKNASVSMASGDLANGLARYDYIVNKYTSCTDVLKRRNEAATAELGNKLFGTGEETSSFETFIVIMGGTLLAGGAILFGMKKLSKRKEQD